MLFRSVAMALAAPGLVLAGAALLAPFALWRARGSRSAALLACVLLACLANAFATGALSGPHDRYQARIAWLLLLPPEEDEEDEPPDPEDPLPPPPPPPDWDAGAGAGAAEVKTACCTATAISRETFVTA